MVFTYILNEVTRMGYDEKTIRVMRKFLNGIIDSDTNHLVDFMKMGSENLIGFHKGRISASKGMLAMLDEMEKENRISINSR